MVRPANNHNGAKTTQRPRTFAQSINVPVDYVYFFYFHGFVCVFGFESKKSTWSWPLWSEFEGDKNLVEIWLRHTKPILFTKHLVVTTFQEGLIPNIHVKKSFKSSGVCFASRLTVHLGEDLKWKFLMEPRHGYVVCVLNITSNLEDIKCCQTKSFVNSCLRKNRRIDCTQHSS